jgi:uncharacterized protein (DUF924 family)
MSVIAPEDILAFWSYEVTPARWFDEDPALDATIRERFLGAYEAAVRGDLKKFEETPEGMLVLLILLDQFPRRMFRGEGRAYLCDELAVNLARDAIIKHFDDRIDKSYKMIFYLPFIHSEYMGDQRLGLFYVRERTKEEEWIKMAEDAYASIERFGRFPERNDALERESTPEEIAYLSEINK